MAKGERLFVKVTRESLPQVKDKYPFLYLERGRLEIDDSSVKWVDSDANVVPIPVATINTLLLGPGTTVTHEAVKTATAANCAVCWVGEDSLFFYAAGFLPTANTRNLKLQMSLASNAESSLQIARAMFAKRFPDAELEGKSLNSMMGMEGNRVRALYQQKAQEYGVGWKGRQFTPGKFELSDLTNQVLTSTNAALYGILCSAVHSMGYSPHIGFIHSGSPLPFVYDLADLYKEQLCIELAFSLSREMAGRYDKHKVSDAFRKRVIAIDLLNQITADVNELMGVNMLVVLANDLPPAVHGRMKLWFVEPRPNVFVSGVKDSVAQTVVDYLMQYAPTESGIMLFRSIPQPPGYEIRYKGEVRKPIINISGLQLIIETLQST
ncbi:type I-E CRISPR-associated endonuclease Cas1e [Mangrovibacter sp. SLW1]